MGIKARDSLSEHHYEPNLILFWDVFCPPVEQATTNDNGQVMRL
jgi:hypothetical protein